MVQLGNCRFISDFVFFAKILWLRQLRRVYDEIIIGNSIFNLRFNFLRHKCFGAEIEIEKDEI